MQYTDEQLVQQCQQPEQQQQAFTAIVTKYQQKLYWHIRRMVILHDDANDVVQNTFVKAWRGLPKFRGDSQLYTWLFRIANNESLTHLAQQKKHNNTIVLNDTVTNLTEAIQATENFDAQKLEWKLQLAIQQLPDKQRSVFNLRYYDVMPYEEMSQVLQTSVGALKASYHFAAKKIEAYLLAD